MSHRVIRGLRWARACQRPAGLPVGRPRGAKALGVRYERSLAKRLTELNHGQWFEFEDQNGPGVCQTDFILTSLNHPDCVFVLECKYSWVIQGHLQIEQLYRPVLEKALALPVHGIVVCKNLKPGIGDIRVASGIGEAQALAKHGRVVWHWLGGVET